MAESRIVFRSTARRGRTYSAKVPDDVRALIAEVPDLTMTEDVVEFERAKAKDVRLAIEAKGVAVTIQSF